MKSQFCINAVRILILLFSVSFATVVQGYWALWDYRLRVSSACLDCDFSLDLVLSSLLPVLLIFIINLLIFRFISKKSIKTTITAFILISTWLIIDTEIFIEREASWSTYTNVWQEGFRLATIPIFTIGSIFIYVFHNFFERISFYRKSNK
ncbi:hypothetical protein [Flavobacterium aestivum]|uniref:hypothetical protein n=1 Tax=Flavobacterium aestivum TaxID=3003257 RepID=UPI002285AA56|nr:hypothetical protein [Flavobacterium aestivum]